MYMYKQPHGMRMGGAIRYIFVFFFWFIGWTWWHEKNLRIDTRCFCFLFLTIRNCWERHLGTTKYTTISQLKERTSAHPMYVYHPWSQMSGSCFIKNVASCASQAKVGIGQTLPPEIMIVELYIYIHCNDISHAYLDVFQSVYFFSKFQRYFKHGKSQIWGMWFTLCNHFQQVYTVVVLSLCTVVSIWRIWL